MNASCLQYVYIQFKNLLTYLIQVVKKSGIPYQINYKILLYPFFFSVFRFILLLIIFCFYFTSLPMVVLKLFSRIYL